MEDENQALYLEFRADLTEDYYREYEQSQQSIAS
jgi:hypothetical protein